MSTETNARRARGESPRGDFEHAKRVASATEQARLEAERKKSEALKQARLAKRSAEQNPASS